MNKIKVMVADDHPAFRDGLSRLLREETDLEVVATPGDGEQAVELASKLKPDLVVMDVSMPKLNGIEATKHLKNSSPEIAILMVSAYDYPGYVLAAVRAGAAGFLLKNAPMRELVKAIRLIFAGEAVYDVKSNGNILCRLAADKVVENKDLEELHPREMQVLTLASKGMGNKDIAKNLDISEHTVQTHLVNIFRKLQVNSRTGAVLQGIKNGWLTLEDFSSTREGID